MIRRSSGADRGDRAGIDGGHTLGWVGRFEARSLEDAPGDRDPEGVVEGLHRVALADRNRRVPRTAARA